MSRSAAASVGDVGGGQKYSAIHPSYASIENYIRMHYRVNRISRPRSVSDHFEDQLFVGTDSVADGTARCKWAAHASVLYLIGDSREPAWRADRRILVPFRQIQTLAALVDVLVNQKDTGAM